MFCESDDVFPDKDTESDYLLALERQQVGLANEDATATRGMSPDCLFRVSTKTFAYKDTSMQKRLLGFFVKTRYISTKYRVSKSAMI